MPVVLVALGLVSLAVVAGAVVHARPAVARDAAAAFRDATSRGLEGVHARIGSPRAAWVAWFALVLVTLLTVVSLVGVALTTVTGGTTALDRGVLDFFHRGRTPGLSTTWNVITTLGDSSLLVPFAATAGLLWRWRRGDWFLMSVLGGAYLGAGLLFNVAKRIVGRARPAAEIAFNAETGHAFPSGHTTDAAAVYTALGLLVLTLVAGWALRVAVGSAAAALVLLIAASRLYLGAHWVTDVVAGAVLGTTWAGVLWVSLTSRAGPYARYATSPDREVGARAGTGAGVRADRP